MCFLGSTKRNHMNITELKGRLADLTEQAKQIRDTADGEKRDMTEKELAEVDRILNDFESVDAELTKRERIEALDNRVSTPQPLPRKTEATPIANLTDPSQPKAPYGSGARQVQSASE